MKKLFVFAAMAAMALTACNDTPIEGPEGSGSGNENGGEQAAPAALVLNELDGNNKFIEIYNPGDAEVSLYGYTIEKDAAKTVWTGAESIKVAAKGYLVLESEDLLVDAEAEGGTYTYESEAHVFYSGLSAKKSLLIVLKDGEGNEVDRFARGSEPWNESGYENNKNQSFSRYPNATGEWVYADPTKGAANGEKVADINHEKEL